MEKNEWDVVRAPEGFRLVSSVDRQSDRCCGVELGTGALGALGGSLYCGWAGHLTVGALTHLLGAARVWQQHLLRLRVEWRESKLLRSGVYTTPVGMEGSQGFGLDPEAVRSH